MGEQAAVDVTKLGFIEVDSPDRDRLVDYYENALGLVVTERTPSSVYLATGGHRHCVVVSESHGRHDGRARLGFEIAGTLDEAARKLGDAGVENETLTDPEPGIPAALVITEPWSGTPLWLYEHDDMPAVPDAIRSRPSKLGHVASYVPDLAEAEGFYRDVLGFRWSDTIGDFFAFLRCNRDHHAINLMQSDTRRGLFHVAFEMRDIVHLKDQLDRLARLDHHLEWGPGRHGAGHNIFTYHHDPDGNLVELFCEIDIVADETTGEFEPRPWHETWPQYPKFWPLDMTAANKWGPINPEMIEH